MRTGCGFIADLQFAFGAFDYPHDRRPCKRNLERYGPQSDAEVLFPVSGRGGQRGFGRNGVFLSEHAGEPHRVSGRNHHSSLLVASLPELQRQRLRVPRVH
nr:MAG TPA: hypothetical protein [Caudoviricetes sp.]